MKNWRRILQGIAGLWLVVTTAAVGQSPPFTQCPPVGVDSSCAKLIVFKPNGKPVVLTDPSQGPYDQIEDTLIGVQNNSNQTVFSISLSSDTDIFGFDGDGLCDVSPHPAGCSFGPTGYEGPGVSFAAQSALAGTVTFANGIAPGDHAYFSLEEANFTLNLCGDNGTKIPESITNFGTCGPEGVKTPTWGSFGVSTELVSDLGEKLELRCEGGINPNTGLPFLPSFHLYYTPPGGTPLRIGTCPFKAGCNNGWFSHAGKNPATGKPRCFIETYWRSRDYGTNDVPNPWTKAAGVDTTAHEPVLDWAVTTYNAVTNNLAKLDYEFQYNPASGAPPVTTCSSGGLRPEGALVRTLDLGDPPLGPDTEAFFDRVFANLQAIATPNDGPMVEAPIATADINSDGARDSGDFATFRAAFGSCAGSASFNPVADIDGDGCVTFLDYQLFLQLFSQP